MHHQSLRLLEVAGNRQSKAAGAVGYDQSIVAIDDATRLALILEVLEPRTDSTSHRLL